MVVLTHLPGTIRAFACFFGFFLDLLLCRNDKKPKDNQKNNQPSDK